MPIKKSNKNVAAYPSDETVLTRFPVAQSLVFFVVYYEQLFVS
jgi:hypothetical protein